MTDNLSGKLNAHRAHNFIDSFEIIADFPAIYQYHRCWQADVKWFHKRRVRRAQQQTLLIAIFLIVIA